MLAVRCFTAPARLAGSIFTSEESDSNTLTNLPSRDAGTNLLNNANNLVAGNARIGKPRKLSLHSRRIRVTNSASLNADTNLSGARCFNRLLD
jgi:hypothetical protein